MASSSAGLHEPADDLTPLVINQHRAIVSIQEELEAVDWYNQRATAADNPDLAAVLAHNRDEEKEHAVMTLEWLRRTDPILDGHLRTYLFTEGSIVEIEHEAEHEDDGESESPSLGIGSLKGEGQL
jgi:ferritin-like protein